MTGSVAGAALGALRGAWRAVSAPEAFFEASTEREPTVLRALGAGLLAGAIGFAVAGWTLARATASDALGFTAIAVALGTGYLLLTWFLGGVVLTRPAQLELRAWEVTALAWLPAGFLGASLLPVAPFFPVPALLVGALAFPVWQLTVIVGALRALSPGRVRTAALFYIGAIYLFPGVLSAFTVWVISQATA